MTVQLSKRPIFWTVFLVAGFLAYHVFAGGWMQKNLPLESELSLFLVNKGVFAIVLGLIIGLLGAWREIGFVRPRGWFWPVWAGPVWLTFAAAIPGAAVALGANPWLSIGYTVIAAAVSFGEEVLFRGVVLQSWRARSLIGAAVISSFLFGSIHLTPFFLGHTAPIFFLQAGVAFSLGLIFAGLTLRSGSLWPALIFHFLVDAVNFVANGGIAVAFKKFELTPQIVAGSIAFILLLTAWGAFLIWLEHRKAKRRSESIDQSMEISYEHA